VVENKALSAYNIFTLAVATFYTAQAVAAAQQQHKNKLSG
jgi:hypothetical protein